MLVRTSLEDKAAPEARALVAQLSAARGDLYDFLAEEVLETLSPSQRASSPACRSSSRSMPETGSLVDGRPPAELAPVIAEAETLGLLTRPDRESPHRFHPLVRDFLVARLREEVGDARVREMHAVVAGVSRTDGLVRLCLALPRSRRRPHAVRVLDAAVPEILAAGTTRVGSSIP